MTGSSRELASLASRVLPAGPMRDLVEECIQFLLEHQFIRSAILPGRYWKVEEGSGMGLPHSGPIADVALYIALEKDLLLTSWFQTKYNISFYSGIHLLFHHENCLFVAGPSGGCLNRADAQAQLCPVLCLRLHSKETRPGLGELPQADKFIGKMSC